MQIVLPDLLGPAKLQLDSSQTLTDDEYYEFCVANPIFLIERLPAGEIILSPMLGGESAYRAADAATQLFAWSKKDRRGKAFGSSEFILPSGAAYSPDAAWVSNDRIAPLTKEQRRKFMPVVPEFVVEVMSPSDRLKAAKAKMAAWIADGVDLAWLIDGDNETVYIYRAGSPEPEKRTGISRVAGEGPVAGFELDLTEIWAGL